MANYSKSFEREENRLMNKGITRSIIAVVLCWVPVVSLIIAIGGFLRIAARVTRAHRVKKFFMLVFSLLVLTAVLGCHIGAVYAYVRNPNIVEELAQKGWTAMTGEETLPWKAQSEIYGIDEYNIDEMEDYNGDYEGLDSDFDDRELAGFEEDLTDDGEESLDESDSPTDADSPDGDDDKKSSDSLELYYKLKSEKGLRNSSPVG